MMLLGEYCHDKQLCIHITALLGLDH